MMALRSLKKLPKLSSSQDKALRSLKKRSSFQDKALRSLKKLPKLSSFQDKARIRQRLRSLKKATQAEFISRSGKLSTGAGLPKKMDKKKTFLRRFGENLF